MLCLLIFAKDGIAAKEQLPLVTVSKVDLTRYMGVWYEIARFDHFFQKGCIGSTASYALLPDGEIEVINRCTDEKDNSPREAKGRAWSVEPDGNARLKVSFFWPFRTDYWIIDLGENYEYAVVGAPSRQYLWIMARKPEMGEAVYQKILGLVTKQGFPIGRLVRKPLSLEP
ncbi:MAG: lipocalin family protein [Desulfuromonadaceae bacterium]|nr:lipocalin family protein [Desulfuromonadaceae bacterium]